MNEKPENKDEEKNNSKENIYCKKIVYLRPNKDFPTIILGVITQEDEFFYKFLTGSGKTHIVHKSQILNISDSKEIFRDTTNTEEETK